MLLCSTLTTASGNNKTESEGGLVDVFLMIAIVTSYGLCHGEIWKILNMAMY